MTLTQSTIPRDAEHVPEFDYFMPDGSKVQQFRQEVTEHGLTYDLVYERITSPKGLVREYRLDPDAKGIDR